MKNHCSLLEIDQSSTAKLIQTTCLVIRSFFFVTAGPPRSLRLVIGKAVSVGQGVVNLACQVMGSVPRTWFGSIKWRDPMVFRTGPNHASHCLDVIL